MNTGDWRAFNATDRHTSDVLLAQSDTGRKVQRESTHEGKTDRVRRAVTQTPHIRSVAVGSPSSSLTKSDLVPQHWRKIFLISYHHSGIGVKMLR